jgi:hypothetical protein
MNAPTILASWTWALNPQTVPRFVPEADLSDPNDDPWEDDPVRCECCGGF